MAAEHRRCGGRIVTNRSGLRPKTDPDIFRLHGQSLGIYGDERDIAAVRDTVLRYADEDGWKTELSPQWHFRQGLRAATREVESRFRRGEKPSLYDGDDWRLFYLGALSDSKKLTTEAIACIMRLTPYSGVAIVLEARSSFAVMQGTRGVSATYEFPPGDDSYLRWRPGVIGEGYSDSATGENLR